MKGQQHGFTNHDSKWKVNNMDAQIMIQNERSTTWINKISWFKMKINSMDTQIMIQNEGALYSLTRQAHR